MLVTTFKSFINWETKGVVIMLVPASSLKGIFLTLNRLTRFSISLFSLAMMAISAGFSPPFILFSTVVAMNSSSKREE